MIEVNALPWFVEFASTVLDPFGPTTVCVSLVRTEVSPGTLAQLKRFEAEGWLSSHVDDSWIRFDLTEAGRSVLIESVQERRLKENLPIEDQPIGEGTTTADWLRHCLKVEREKLKIATEALEQIEAMRDNDGWLVGAMVRVETGFALAKVRK